MSLDAWSPFSVVFFSRVDVHFLLVAAGGAHPLIEQLWGPMSADLSWGPLGQWANQRR